MVFLNYSNPICCLSVSVETAAEQRTNFVTTEMPVYLYSMNSSLICLWIPHMAQKKDNRLIQCNVMFIPNIYIYMCLNYQQYFTVAIYQILTIIPSLTHVALKLEYSEFWQNSANTTANDVTKALRLNLWDGYIFVLPKEGYIWKWYFMCMNIHFSQQSLAAEWLNHIPLMVLSCDSSINPANATHHLFTYSVLFHVQYQSFTSKCK